MAPKKLWDENMQARFQKGTFRRIKAVLKETEERTTSCARRSNGS